MPAAVESIAHSIGRIETNKVALGTLGTHIGRFIILVTQLAGLGDQPLLVMQPHCGTISVLLDHIHLYLKHLAEKSLLQQVLQQDKTAFTILMLDLRLKELVRTMRISSSLEEYDMAVALEQDSSDLARLTSKLEGSVLVQSQYLETLHDVQRFLETRIFEIHSPLQGELRKLLTSTCIGLESKVGRKLSPTMAWSISSSDVYIMRSNLLRSTPLGNVHNAIWNGARVAVEVILGTITSAVVQLIEQDANKWFPLEHPHILKLMGLCLNADQPFIVTAPTLCTLREHLKRNPSLDTMSLNSIVMAIAKGMHYLHILVDPIVHGNLSMDCICLDLDGQVCVSGFSMSRTTKFLHAGNDSILSPQWKAPEYDDEGYIASLPADVFAYGNLCFEVFSEHNQMANTADGHTVSMPVQGNEQKTRPQRMSDTVWEVTRLCWNPDQAKRPTFKDIMRKFELMSLYETTPSSTPVNVYHEIQV
ncbi:hypothetical protein BASA81_018058 [Batrachochytrium salamandrivorans]|nr:hypothetical protein BASA81_018058 [Batrachochytrium salamandrivorans]